MKTFDLIIVTSTMQHPDQRTVVEMGIKKRSSKGASFLGETCMMLPLQELSAC